MKKRILALLFAGVMGLSLVGCGSKDPSTVAASVNGEEITLGELEFMLKMNKAGIESSMNGQDLWDEEIEEGVTYREKYKELMVDQLVTTEVIAQDAEKTGLKPSEAEVNAAFADLKNTIDSDEDMKNSAKELGVTDEFLKKQSGMQLLLTAHQDKFNKETSVTEDKVKKYYDEHKADYVIDEVEASHILIKTTDDNNQPLPEDKQKEAKKRAEKVLKEVKAGGDFAELAKKYSEDPGSGAEGGQLGMFGKGEMVPEFEKAAFSMKVGEVSDLVKTDFGYHIIKVTDKRNETTSYAEAKEGIKSEILNQMYGQKIEELKKNSKIERDEDVIKSAEF